jgi:hypothetical protein
MSGALGFREYLAGLLAPRDRSKTLTALAGAEPVTGSKLPAVQRLQFFLPESACRTAQCWIHAVTELMVKSRKRIRNCHREALPGQPVSEELGCACRSRSVLDSRLP